MCSLSNLTIDADHLRGQIRDNSVRIIDVRRAEDYKKDQWIEQRLSSSSATDQIIEQVPNCENIFSISEIRNICTRYRLRFLETKHLRYPLPYEAFIKIKEFEKGYRINEKKAIGLENKYFTELKSILGEIKKKIKKIMKK